MWSCKCRAMIVGYVKGRESNENTNEALNEILDK